MTDAMQVNIVEIRDRVFQFKDWGGRVQTVLAQQVRFEPGGVVSFWDLQQDRLVLAVPLPHWNDLTEICEPQPPMPQLQAISQPGGGWPS